LIFKFFFFIFLLCSLNAKANISKVDSLDINTCNFSQQKFISELRDVSSIINIDVKLANYKKWIINSLKILTSLKENIRVEYKKRYKAVVIVTYDFGKCKYEARVRQHGDWKDHISYFKNNNTVIEQSLNIKLKKGNILGIVEFILFTSNTRGLDNGKNEVIATELLKNLGFLAPKSFVINTTINFFNSKMLFQEKINKEFLENQNRREGPIFEGDEQLIWEFGVTNNHKKWEDFESLSLSRMDNSKWALKNDDNLKTSIRALANLQEIYLDYATNVTNRNLALNIDLLSNNSYVIKNKWMLYELFLISIGADHALRPHNRKFYWNTFENVFEPIYYDGNVALKSLCNSDGYFIHSRMIEGDINYYAKLFDSNIYNNLKLKIYDMEKINLSFRLNKLNIKVNKQDLNYLYSLIIKNLDCLKNTFNQVKNNNNDKINIHELINKYKLILEELNFPIYLVHNNKSNNSIIGDHKICLKDKCEFFEIQKKWKDILKHKFKLDGKHVFYLGSKDWQNNFVFDKIKELNLSVVFSKGVTFSYKEDEGTLYIKQNLSSNRVIFLNGNISNLKIKFYSAELNKNQKEQIIIPNKNTYTGCLTFYNINFNNSQITANGGFCEDTVNIVNSRGNINTISITNSASDALDFDFSQIDINKINIDNAKNDCVDFSYGFHKINEMLLNRCGDKGISIGESTIFIGASAFINHSNHAIVSKDSSFATVNNLKVLNSKICASAYNKKQEFDGGYLKINNMNCENNYKKFNKDDNSFLEINNQQLINNLL